MEPGDLVLRLLSSIGNQRDARFYLSLFRAERRESFAIIAVAEAVMREMAEALIVDLRLLARLGLTPVIQFGVIDPGQARAHAERVALALAPDVAARVTSIDKARELAASGVIPLIPTATLASPAASAPDRAATDRTATDRRFDRLAELAETLQARKIVVLGRKSGLERDGGSTISLVNLTTEYDTLRNVLPPDEAELLRQSCRLVSAVSHSITISVTSPLDLLRELFTMRGAGTLLRRGSAIARFAHYRQIERARLQVLIESAFSKTLAPEFFEHPVSSLYLADDYRGVAIVEDTACAPYLTKFAVDRRAQGEGVGRDLWRALVSDRPRLYWRSRADNPITRWYQQQCDGMMRAQSWFVFWRGLSIDDVPAAVAHASSARVDLS